jgi:hypothetical protein
MIFSHLPGILAWVWHPISNGPAEGFNSAIQTPKHIARTFVTSPTSASRCFFTTANSPFPHANPRRGVFSILLSYVFYITWAVAF